MSLNGIKPIDTGMKLNSNIPPEVKQMDDIKKQNMEFLAKSFEQIHTLEMVSGYSIESLIDFFKEGYRLTKPDRDVYRDAIDELAIQQGSMVLMDRLANDLLKDILLKESED